MTREDLSLEEGLAVERVRKHADHVHRRAEILRQFADQQEGYYRPVADKDADNEEQLSADLRLLLTVVEGELRGASGAGPDVTPSCGATDAHNHSGKEDR